MQAELLDILSLVFMILSLFFLAVSVVIWFGFHIFHDISVLTGLGAKMAIKKMKRETRGNQVKFAAIKSHKKKASISWGNTGNTKKPDITGEMTGETTIINNKDFEETVLLNEKSS
ncbi:hypothetical protein [Butyrivibrio sp. NC2002]|uniref:hypothetical protein n=1 Tax=Butyrivibrio sp. NC2002 TaxID=1410610 RepID=UPI00056CBC57|nr:hypothetical protein [Butyrivibrio sp. NC2002]